MISIEIENGLLEHLVYHEKGLCANCGQIHEDVSKSLEDGYCDNCDHAQVMGPRAALDHGVLICENQSVFGISNW